MHIHTHIMCSVFNLAEVQKVIKVVVKTFDCVYSHCKHTYPNTLSVVQSGETKTKKNQNVIWKGFGKHEHFKKAHFQRDLLT